ncbi:CHAP domain-containing protein [Gluconacetobacter azotocaptans]|uniref:CHAP domain-containing protein n=1 Tax=Gluconacetobacter azotocaptans TaxID=142834 RepID=A0A7W4JV65_9PROT|nr:CHAP domain-containing protein [Gluconacetobacter azotocaptans]MBB2191500.1 CHAP domain-containing protein [Gluconacetobacter azotocaptans]MBM9403032.1 CHAP domain-containing protein [Gluconacetobacter azotocaptans]GBQ32802.1 hypothetical protein AA13594_2477 [Gluconacetobacter azotocaptans DSM 13594]
MNGGLVGRVAGRLAGVLAVAGVLPLAACGGGRGGWHGSVQCAPYARAETGLRLSGAAAGWWRQSAGVYAHSRMPAPGAVLVFRSTSRLPDGHVSVVRQVRGTRAILVDQANWEPGRVDHDVPVVDVSRDNDWSAVRVWWQPVHSMGKSVYPTYGFISRDLPQRPSPDA